jgi:hypothetical protein
MRSIAHTEFRHRIVYSILRKQATPEPTASGTPHSHTELEIPGTSAGLCPTLWEGGSLPSGGLRVGPQGGGGGHRGRPILVLDQYRNRTPSLESNGLVNMFHGDWTPPGVSQGGPMEAVFHWTLTGCRYTSRGRHLGVGIPSLGSLWEGGRLEPPAGAVLELCSNGVTLTGRSSNGSVGAKLRPIPNLTRLSLAEKICLC